MPTYEYVCSKCDEHLEVYQSFSEDPLKRHRGCGGKLTKVFGSVGIVLKGSGFYRTDNPSSSRRSAEKSDSSASNGSTSGGESGGSGDSKSGDSKSGDSKSGDSKKSETKTSDTKKSEAKPAKTA
jgi:putative FmdB family regulatory protein